MEPTLQQIVLLLALVAGVRPEKKLPCLEESRLLEAAGRRLLTHYLQPLQPAATGATGASGAPPPAACPLQLHSLAANQGDNSRSVSPWRYLEVQLPDHYPSSYFKADCLCNGCIQFADGKAFESPDFNSKPIKQSRIFLRREQCENATTYRLVPVRLDVAVGCICVRVRTTVLQDWA